MFQETIRHFGRKCSGWPTPACKSKREAEGLVYVLYLYNLDLFDLGNLGWFFPCVSPLSGFVGFCCSVEMLIAETDGPCRLAFCHTFGVLSGHHGKNCLATGIQEQPS